MMAELINGTRVLLLVLLVLLLLLLLLLLVLLLLLLLVAVEASRVDHIVVSSRPRGSIGPV